MSKAKKPLTLEDVMRQSARVVGDGVQLIITTLGDLPAEELLSLFGKEVPEQEPIVVSCRKKCGAPAVCDRLCIVHFSAKLLGYDLPLTVAVLQQKGFELPEQWATTRSMNRTIAILEGGKALKEPKDEDRPSENTADLDPNRPLTSKLWPRGGVMALEDVFRVAQEDFQGVKFDALKEAVEKGEIKCTGGKPYAQSAKSWLKKNCQRK